MSAIDFVEEVLDDFASLQAGDLSGLDQVTLQVLMLAELRHITALLETITAKLLS